MKAEQEAAEEEQSEVEGGGAAAVPHAGAASSSAKSPAPLNPFDVNSQLLPSCPLFDLFALPFTAGATYYNEARSVEYVAGTAPIIISVPHGGHLHSAVPGDSTHPPPSSPTSSPHSPSFQLASTLPDRVSGCHEKDLNTQELGRAVHAELRRLLPPPFIPHLIISRVHRRKVDLNRSREDSAECEEGRRVWDDYHRCILRAKRTIARGPSQAALTAPTSSSSSTSPPWLYGRVGLLIDVHGQRHDSRCQLGYLLNSADLTLLSSSSPPSTSSELSSLSSRFSLHSLWQSSPSRCPLQSMVAGEHSLGQALESRGFPCIPSPSSPVPEPGLLYFNGGFTTNSHGSAPRSLQKKREKAEEAEEAAGPGGEEERERWNAEMEVASSISSLQIETAYDSIRSNAAHRQRFAAALASSLLDFLTAHATQQPQDGTG